MNNKGREYYQKRLEELECPRLDDALKIALKDVAHIESDDYSFDYGDLHGEIRLISGNCFYPFAEFYFFPTDEGYETDGEVGLWNTAFLSWTEKFKNALEKMTEEEGVPIKIHRVLDISRGISSRRLLKDFTI
jgi:hypothetical protein